MLMPKTWRLPTDNEETAFYVMPFWNNTLKVVTPEDFDEINRTLSDMDLSNEENLNAITLVGSLSQMIIPDKQGRFSISKEIQEYAHLDKKAVLVGAIAFGRIISEELWEKCGRNPANLVKLEKELFVAKQRSQNHSST